MDELRTHLVRESISDAIGILDSAPIRPDMFPQMYLLQVGNRIPVAHLAIEHGLKALIRHRSEERTSTDMLDWLDGRKGRTHRLGTLYAKLKEIDEDSAFFLSNVFDDAVQYFRYNSNRKGFKHFRSLHDYFSAVATSKVYEAMRYWVIESNSDQETAIFQLSPQIHREILCALWCLFLPSLRQTVSERVEKEVACAIYGNRHELWVLSDSEKSEKVRWYENWLVSENASFCEALKNAKIRDFEVKEGDNFISRILKVAWEELQQSSDPAITYFLQTLTYLPEASQTQDPNAIPKIEWINEGLSCKIETPSGICLGFARKQPDGAWSILPMQSGATGTIPPAVKLKDAANFLLHRLTRQVTVNVSDRIIQTRIVWDKDMFVGNGRCELVFWDAEHGLAGGDHVLVTIHPLEKRPIVHQFRGSITEVEDKSVTMEGTNRIRVWEDVEK